jgi:hypothetical protein
MSVDATSSCLSIKPQAKGPIWDSIRLPPLSTQDAASSCCWCTRPQTPLSYGSRLSTQRPDQRVLGL